MGKAPQNIKQPVPGTEPGEQHRAQNPGTVFNGDIQGRSLSPPVLGDATVTNGTEGCGRMKLPPHRAHQKANHRDPHTECQQTQGTSKHTDPKVTRNSQFRGASAALAPQIRWQRTAAPVRLLIVTVGKAPARRCQAN